MRTPDAARALKIIIAQNLNTKFDDIVLVAPDSSGRCRSLREWWHKQQ